MSKPKTKPTVQAVIAHGHLLSTRTTGQDAQEVARLLHAIGEAVKVARRAVLVEVWVAEADGVTAGEP